MVGSFLFLSYCIFYGVNTEHYSQYSNNEEDQWDSDNSEDSFEYESGIITAYKTVNECTEQNDRITISDETESSTIGELVLPEPYSQYSNNGEDQWDSGSSADSFEYESDIITVYKTVNECTEQNDRITISDETESSTIGELVLPDRTMCIGPNEELKCVKSCPPAKTCRNRDILFNCIDNSTVVCKNECICKEGFYRNDKGGCVTSEMCDKTMCTGPNEELKCVKSCPPAKTCRNRDILFNCIDNATEVCKNECICKEGFYRNDKGGCVTSEMCDSLKCGINEVLVENPSPCSNQFCPESRESIIRPCPASISRDIKLPPRCECRFNYSRAKNGTCIPTEQCPPFPCGRNEMFVACPPYCPTDDCSQATPSGKCPIIGRIGIVVPCRPQCRCIKNYWRRNNVCVPFEQCNEPECNKPNESLQCVKACPPERTCQNRNVSYKCAYIMNEVCKKKCVCNNGFYRDSNGFCVTSDLCDKKCTGPNEMYTPNKKKCPPEICRFIVSRYACDPKEQGQPGCVCKTGFLRMNLTSTCMPIKQCPELINSQPNCTKPNESLQCVKACPPERTCQNRNVFYKCANNMNEVCENKCVCNDRFFRDSNGLCVTSELCVIWVQQVIMNQLRWVKGGPNEMYVPNIKSCPPQTCQSTLALYKCDSKEQGQPGCLCKLGFLRRDSNSTCIPADQYPEFKTSPDSNKTMCTGPNEELKCVKSCPPAKTCRNRDILFKCFDNATEVCKNKCICKEGFYRNDKGGCVTSEMCEPQCNKPNESLQCVKACPPERTCQNRNVSYKCANNMNEVCKKKCVCNNGFYRDSNGFCVTSDLCEPQCNKPNESLQCVKACPPERTCQNRKVSYKCANNMNEVCENKCVCNDGFFRDSNGFCVTSELCDKTMCTGPNEELKCVKSCPPAKTCRNRYILFRCIDNETEVCKNECICKEGFYRNDKGYCVTGEMCDNSKCQMNEVLVENPSPCGDRYCPVHKEAINRPCSATISPGMKLRPRCECRFNYSRAKNGTCIPTSQCPPFPCGPNESRSADVLKIVVARTMFVFLPTKAKQQMYARMVQHKLQFDKIRTIFIQIKILMILNICQKNYFEIIK
ncbi:unnamed protein product [Parnassius apollo]|uniref:(apollo) hypothetical protein n=1 Tax=Parnassius apollo TaxID=110799 RepID=A0A8S3WGI6_PARAO|nr:unnamed protein product [Parnassius apollo]